MQSYCSYARIRSDHHRKHHDTEHGFPAKDDDDLFRRLFLEISQAGLSFDTVLRRKQTIYAAFPGVAKVAAFTEKDVERLMQDPGIIRNRLKIHAAIYNAKKIVEIQGKYGSFINWLDSNSPKTRVEWVKLFKREFKFVGGEIVNEFLMSTGHLPGAHDSVCHVGKEISKKR